MIFHKEDIQAFFQSIGKGNTRETLKNQLNGFRERFSTNLIPNETNNKLNELINTFQTLQGNTQATAQSFQELYDEARALGGQPLVDVFKGWAEQGAAANANLEDLYATMLGQNTKGISNVLDIIKTFNEMGSSDDQQAFANAVGQTNTNLGNYLGNLKNSQASGAGYVGYLVKATAKTVAMTAATAALNMALSMGISLLITVATWVFDEITHGVENATNKLNENVEVVKSLESELDGLQKELKKNQERLTELSNIDSPTLFEQDEIDIIKEKNDELERTIRLKELELEIAKQEQEEAAKAAAYVYTQGSDVAEWVKWISSWLNFAFGGPLGLLISAVGADQTYNKPEVDKTNKLLDSYKEALEFLNSVDDEFSDENGFSQEYRDETKSNIEARLREYKTALTAQRNTIEQMLLQLDPNDPRYSELQTILDQYDEIFGYMGSAKTFTDVYNLSKFSNVTNQLEQLVKQNELTEESFNNVEGIEEFRDALTSIGITDINEILRAIIKNVDESADVAESAGDKYNYLTSQIEGLKAAIDSTFTNQSTLQSAFDKIQEGSSLSADEVRKLVDICSEDFPEISTLFEKTADGYTVSANNLIKANKAIIESTKESIKKEINGYKEVIEAYESRAYDANGVLTNYRKEAKYDDKGFAIKTLGEYVNVTAEKYEDAKNKVNEFTLILDMLGISLEDNTTSLEKYNEVMKTFTSNISTGASAQQEMNENGQISASTLESLLALGDEYIKCINIENGIISFNAELFKDISKAKLEDELATVRLAEAEAIYNRNVDAMYGGHNHERLQSILDDITLKRQLLEDRYNNIDDIFSKAVEDKGSKDTSDPNKDAFDAEVAKRKHWLEMGKDELGNIFTKADYYEWLNGADGYKKYFQDVSKYQTEIWANEEEIFKYYQDVYKEETQKTVDDIEKQYERGELSFEQYMKNLAEIRDSKYGGKSTYEKQMQDEWGLGNVDLTKRPKVKMDDGSIATVLSGGQFIWQGSEENGGYVYVHYTPILPDGTILDDNALSDYLLNTLEGSNNILETDSKNKGLVLKVDTDLNLTSEDIKSLENGKWTDHVKTLAEGFDAWDIGLHEAQALWVEISETQDSLYAGTEFATEEYKALTKQITEAAEKNADTEVEKYKSQLSKKNITPEEYVKNIYDLRDDYKKLYNVDLSQKWLDDALDVDNYEYELERLQNANDKSLASERNYIAEWRKLSANSYNNPNSKNYDVSKYQSILKEITDYEIDVLSKAYQKGEITAEEYKQGVKDALSEAGALGVDYLSEKSEALIKEVTDTELERLAEAFKKGKINAEEYAESVAKILGDADILGAKYLSEKQEDIDKNRAEREKSYWEQQKQYAESYYDKQIEDIKKAQEEQEKVNKLQELYLKLQKAKQTLEDAKNNRNQLIFNNGTFEYVSDQDAIVSAQEEINSTLKEIEDEKLQSQIDILEEQKDEAVSFYDDMISMIEAYIAKTVDITESDSEILQKIANSEYAELWRQIRSGEKKPNEITTEQKDYLKNDDNKSKTGSTAMDFAASLLGMTVSGIQSIVSNLLGGGNSTVQNLVGNVAQDTLNSAISNVYTDSTVNNNTSVKVGDVHVTVQGDTSQEMLTQFANQLSTAFSTAAAKSFA